MSDDEKVTTLSLVESLPLVLSTLMDCADAPEKALIVVVTETEADMKFSIVSSECPEETMRLLLGMIARLEYAKRQETMQ